jgi:hypothetical protein
MSERQSILSVLDYSLIQIHTNDSFSSAPSDQANTINIHLSLHKVNHSRSNMKASYLCNLPGFSIVANPHFCTRKMRRVQRDFKSERTEYSYVPNNHGRVNQHDCVRVRVRFNYHYIFMKLMHVDPDSHRRHAYDDLHAFVAIARLACTQYGGLDTND